MSKKRTRRCEYCGVIFPVYLNEIIRHRGQFHSKQCAGFFNYQDKYKKVCKTCGIEFSTFTNREFCCIECECSYTSNQ
jgi:hypothetical protein